MEKVPAGFPSPAEDYLETPLDLTEYLIENKAATFMMRVDGDSMTLVYRKGVVTDVSGPRCNACPGTLTL